MSKFPINLTNLFHQRTIESERVEYKAGWNPESIVHTLSAFANDFHNFRNGGGMNENYKKILEQNKLV